MVLHSDLPEKVNEHFDRIMRDPAEFRTWVRLVFTRAGTPGLALHVAEAMLGALWQYLVTDEDLDDEYIEAAEARLDAALRGCAQLGLERKALMRGNGHGFDVRSFDRYAAQRATERSLETEPEGPFGAKGVGEIGLVPTAGAVAGALAAFDGIRRTRLPMIDSPAARAMSVGKKGRKSQRKTRHGNAE